MKVLLLGANGQVGWELQRALAPLGMLEICDRKRADLSQPDRLALLIDRIRPEVIINAAAYTAVDKAQTDQKAAQQVNAEAVAVLANAARELDALLVHYSTDYVFDGSLDRPHAESDACGPLNVYGATKLEGERLIRASGCKHLILRTSWVYGVRGTNFAKTMLRLASERDELRVVADQIGAPTSAELIADVSALMINRLCHDAGLAAEAYGTYHLVASGETSWHGYARYVIDTARSLGLSLKAESVLPINAEEFPVAAMRPANSRLATAKLQATFGVTLPHWQYHVQRMLKEVVPLEVATRLACEQLDGAIEATKKTTLANAAKVSE